MTEQGEAALPKWLNPKSMLTKKKILNLRLQLTIDLNHGMAVIITRGLIFRYKEIVKGQNLVIKFIIT